jgi:two-component system KDP operon response regulator KdpE
VNELLARMRASLRVMARASVGHPEPAFTAGRLHVDLERRQVFIEHREVHLTPIEYKLLVTLVRYAGKVVTHRQLLKEVWGPLHTEEGHYVRVYMRQLRNKLEVNPAHPQHLLTELGVGYRLKTD